MNRIIAMKMNGDGEPENEADDGSNNGESKPSQTEQSNTLNGFDYLFVCLLVCLLVKNQFLGISAFIQIYQTSLRIPDTCLQSSFFYHPMID